MTRITSVFKNFVVTAFKYPGHLIQTLKRFPDSSAGRNFGSALVIDPKIPPLLRSERQNDLSSYFEGHQTGLGIWKWLHYFEIYDRFLYSFRGKDIVMVEVGVYSGGSIGMWKSYFGTKLVFHGVDIEPACKGYEENNVNIHIGDQEDRSFWRKFLAEVPEFDVFIDDGGHSPEQQRITFEEVFPHLKPGGIYICEDIFGENNGFFHFLTGLLDKLNHSPALGQSITPLQAAIGGAHVFPYIVVVEKSAARPETLSAARRGNQWQPFFDRLQGTE